MVIVDPSCFSPPYDHCLCEALARRGIDVTLARRRLEPGTWANQGSYGVWDKFYPIAIRITHPEPLRRFLKGMDHIFSMRRFATAMEGIRPDVIHFEWLPLPSVDLRFLPRLRRLSRLVMTVHDSNPFHGSPSSSLQRMGAMKALAGMDRLIAHTEYTRKALAKEGIDEGKIRIVSHGAFGYYEDIASSTRLHSEMTRTLVFFGSIKPYKGVDLLLRAFATLRKTLRETATLVIAGTPAMDLGALKHLAEQLGIAHRVEWRIGFVDERDVAPLLWSARAVVLPYREIDQSGVLLAAIGVGVPIIATSVGGIPETIDSGVHGLVVPPGDVVALSAAMETLLGNSELCLQMRSALLRLRDTKLSWNSVADVTIDTYREVLADPSCRPTGLRV